MRVGGRDSPVAPGHPPVSGTRAGGNGPVALAWSGGKDSCLALWALRTECGIEPAALVTTVTSDYERISVHGVRRELLRAQAAAVGCPLVEVELPAGFTNAVYEERMASALETEPLHDVDHIAFGDLFLADVRASRERLLGALDKRPLFPLWGRRTTDLARHFLQSGFQATVVCVDPAQVPASLAGEPYDAHFLARLPPDADPCGENGEFHTFVWAGPMFDGAVRCRRGKIVRRQGLVYADLQEEAGAGGGAATVRGR